MFKRIPILLFVIFTLFACKEEKVQLKWKIPAGEVIIYNIKMETIDSLSSVSDVNLQELVQQVAKMYGDSVEVPVDANDLYKGLIRQLNLLSYFSILRLNGTDEVKIDFITRQTKQYGEIKYLEIFNKFIKKAFFKGTLSPDGTLLSNSGEPVWDPKINILFQLPEHPVSVGDSWPLNILSEWQEAEKGKQDSSINKVTLSEIIMDGPDSIAVLQYHLQNADEAGRTLSFSGTGKFNITQGKWISYTGFLSQKKTGVLPMNQVQRINLYEISVEKYKAILKQAQKMDIFDAGNDFITEENSDANSAVDNENDNADQTVSNADCPTIYRIQVLATQNPVKDKATQFKGLNYKVDELVLSNDEKFKYKYTVGEECSHESAKALLEEIKKSGYPQAYIIKTPSK